MKKFFNKFLALALILALSVSLSATSSVSAEENNESTEFSSDYSPVSWYPVVKNKSKTYTGSTGNTIIANCYFERLVLTGFRNGIGKINKTFKKLAKQYNCDNAHMYAKIISEESSYSKSIFYDTVEMTVPFCGEKYVCLTTTRYTYYGGVGNTFTNGYVFDLDTGKKKTITAVTGLSEKEIKEKLIESIKTDPDLKKSWNQFASQIELLVNGLNVKDIDFLIDSDGSISIIVAPYTDPLCGGWTNFYKLKGVTIDL